MFSTIQLLSEGESRSPSPSSPSPSSALLDVPQGRHTRSSSASSASSWSSCEEELRDTDQRLSRHLADITDALVELTIEADQAEVLEAPVWQEDERSLACARDGEEDDDEEEGEGEEDGEVEGERGANEEGEEVAEADVEVKGEAPENDEKVACSFADCTPDFALLCSLCTLSPSVCAWRSGAAGAAEALLPPAARRRGAVG